MPPLGAAAAATAWPLAALKAWEASETFEACELRAAAITARWRLAANSPVKLFLRGIVGAESRRATTKQNVQVCIKNEAAVQKPALAAHRECCQKGITNFSRFLKSRLLEARGESKHPLRGC